MQVEPSNDIADWLKLEVSPAPRDCRGEIVRKRVLYGALKRYKSFKLRVKP